MTSRGRDGTLASASTSSPDVVRELRDKEKDKDED
jgi:hypothetical protein